VSSMFHHAGDATQRLWISQEFINTVIHFLSAAASIPPSRFPLDATKQLLKLLVKIVCTGNASVTVCRALAVLSHALAKDSGRSDALLHFGFADSLSKALLTAMNARELSVRSMAVDTLIGVLVASTRPVAWMASVSEAVIEVLAHELLAVTAGAPEGNSFEQIVSAYEPLRLSAAELAEGDERVGEDLATGLRLLARDISALRICFVLELKLDRHTQFAKRADRLRRANNYGGAVSKRLSEPRSVADVYVEVDEAEILAAANAFSPTSEVSASHRLRWLSLLVRYLEGLKGTPMERDGVEVANCKLMMADAVAMVLTLVNEGKGERRGPSQRPIFEVRVSQMGPTHTQPHTLTNTPTTQDRWAHSHELLYGSNAVPRSLEVLRALQFDRLRLCDFGDPRTAMGLVIDWTMQAARALSDCGLTDKAAFRVSVLNGWLDSYSPATSIQGLSYGANRAPSDAYFLLALSSKGFEIEAAAGMQNLAFLASGEEYIVRVIGGPDGGGEAAMMKLIRQLQVIMLAACMNSLSL